MKGYLSALIVVILLCLSGLIGGIMHQILFPQPKPLSTLECPCEADLLVKDVIKHTNKEGMTTVTTYLDVSKCVGLK